MTEGRGGQGRRNNFGEQLGLVCSILIVFISNFCSRVNRYTSRIFAPALSGPNSQGYVIFRSVSQTRRISTKFAVQIENPNGRLTAKD